MNVWCIVLLVASVFSINAKAGSCELKDGKTLSGTYIQATTLGSAPSRSSISFKMDQRGCSLSVKPTVIENWNSISEKGSIIPKVKKITQGTWHFDLTGEKPAVIPQEYIQANSHKSKDAAITKSLEVFTKINDEGELEVKTYFNLSHAGATVKMLAESTYQIYSGSISFGNSKQEFTGSMSLKYPGVKFSVVPDAKLEAETGAKNLAIRTSANWLLELFQPQISSALHYWDLYWAKL